MRDCLGNNSLDTSETKVLLGDGERRKITTIVFLLVSHHWICDCASFNCGVCRNKALTVPSSLDFLSRVFSTSLAGMKTTLHLTTNASSEADQVTLYTLIAVGFTFPSVSKCIPLCPCWNPKSEKERKKEERSDFHAFCCWVCFTLHRIYFWYKKRVRKEKNRTFSCTLNFRT